MPWMQCMLCNVQIYSELFWIWPWISVLCYVRSKHQKIKFWSNYRRLKNNTKKRKNKEEVLINNAWLISISKQRLWNIRLIYFISLKCAILEDVWWSPALKMSIHFLLELSRIVGTACTKKWPTSCIDANEKYVYQNCFNWLLNRMLKQYKKMHGNYYYYFFLLQLALKWCSCE